MALAVGVAVQVALGGTRVGVALAVGVSVGAAVMVSVIEGARATPVGVNWRAMTSPMMPVARQSIPDSRLKTMDQTKSCQPR